MAVCFIASYQMDCYNKRQEGDLIMTDTQADGYYSEPSLDDGDLDLSFLDDDES